MRVADLKIGAISGDFILKHCTLEVIKGKSGYYKRHDCTAKCLVCGRTRKFASVAFMSGSGTSHKNCGKEELAEFNEKHPEFHRTYLKLRERACRAKIKLERGNYSRDYMEDELETWSKSYEEIKYYIDFYDNFHEAWLEAERKFKGQALYPWLKVPKDGIVKGNLEFSIKTNIRMNTNSKCDVWQAVAEDGKTYISRGLSNLCKVLGLNYTATHGGITRNMTNPSDPVVYKSITFLKVGTANTVVSDLSNGIDSIEVSKPLKLKRGETYATISILDKRRYGNVMKGYRGGKEVVVNSGIQ